VSRILFAEGWGSVCGVRPRAAGVNGRDVATAGRPVSRDIIAAAVRQTSRRGIRPREDQMESTEQIGAKLVELCRQQKNLEAVATLYRPDAVSVEAVGNEAMPAVVNGRDAIRAKNEWWFANNQVHRSNLKGPFPNGDRFAVIFEFEFTPNQGPRAGQRTSMEEVAVYTVEKGKIIREEFFYTMS
jgi:hypothetical protein